MNTDKVALPIFGYSPVWQLCAALLLIISVSSAAQPADGTFKSHIIPIGDAGVGLVVKLPPVFLMDDTPSGYYSFRTDYGVRKPLVWASARIRLQRSVSAVQADAITAIRRETVKTLSEPVEWLSWEHKTNLGHRMFHREVYLEHIARLIQDPYKAERLEGFVVTFSISGYDESEVDEMQKYFVDAELHESTLPPADSQSPERFVEAHYRLPWAPLGGESYEFHLGRFTCQYSTDVGEPPPPKQGRYQVDGTRLLLFFDKPQDRPTVFYYRLIAGVHVILEPASLHIFESQSRLVPEYYFSASNLDRDDRDFRMKVARQHPEFARMANEGGNFPVFSEVPKAKLSFSSLMGGAEAKVSGIVFCSIAALYLMYTVWLRRRTRS